MICLIDIETAGRESLVEKLRHIMNKDAGVRCRKSRVLGMPALRVTIPVTGGAGGEAVPKLPALRRKIGAAVRQIKAHRAGRVVFSKDFPYREMILREGFEEADGTVLTALLAGELAQLACPGGKTAVLFSDSLTGWPARALWKLGAHFRHVLTVTAADGRALYKAIGKRYGISVIDKPSPAQLCEADAALVFDPPAEGVKLSEACVVIPVRGADIGTIACRRVASDFSFGLKNGGEDAVPAGFPRNALIACALEAGVLSTADIVVRSVRVKTLPQTVRYG
jgi:hypothetical protein